MYAPARPIIKCPALIFAANRTERVKGRMSILKVSTKTRKGMSPAGAPAGLKEAKKPLTSQVNEDKTKANQALNPKLKVKIKWEVVEKI